MNVEKKTKVIESLTHTEIPQKKQGRRSWIVKEEIRKGRKPEIKRGNKHRERHR